MQSFLNSLHPEEVATIRHAFMMEVPITEMAADWHNVRAHLARPQYACQDPGGRLTSLDASITRNRSGNP